MTLFKEKGIVSLIETKDWLAVEYDCTGGSSLLGLCSLLTYMTSDSAFETILVQSIWVSRLSVVS